MHKYDLEGRTTIVTRGAKGIGYACAERLLDSGAAVSIRDIDAAALNEAVTALSVKGEVQGLACPAANGPCKPLHGGCRWCSDNPYYMV